MQKQEVIMWSGWRVWRHLCVESGFVVCVRWRWRLGFGIRMLAEVRGDDVDVAMVHAVAVAIVGKPKGKPVTQPMYLLRRSTRAVGCRLSGGRLKKTQEQARLRNKGYHNIEQ